MYIGIDLGTSNSVIAGVVDNKVRIFHPADGGEVLPSAIFIDKRGHRLYGRRAHDQGLIAPENVASGFKRLMGSDTPVEVSGAGITLSPEECSAEIIRQLLGQATTETGIEQFTGAIITVPASFNQMQAEATLRAAKLAGLDRVDLLQEPIAAAMASMENAERSGQFLIYDLGGGTFDIALARAKNGEVNIVAHQGINMLGGRDFDRIIVNEVIRPWLATTFDLPENFQRDPNYRRLMRIAQLAAEKAKIDLSMKDETVIFASDDDVRMADLGEAEIFIDMPLTRAHFEEMVKTPILQTVSLIRTILEENDCTPETIDRIVFVGGSSRIPLVRKIVSQELGIPADLNTDPMTAVAVGAAYYCESRQWNVGDVSKPKPTEASTIVAEEPDLSFDYAQRTPDEKTIVTLRVKTEPNEPHQIRIKSEDWDSGELPLADGLTIMLPLNQNGPNRFEAFVLDDKGAPLSAAQEIIITRVVASASNIPAAQTIAVKVLTNGNVTENRLQTLVQKNTPLPADGRASFISAKDLLAGAGGNISFELFQVEYPERIDLNLCIGQFRIASDDLPVGTKINAGDTILFNWQITESGILQANVTLPNVMGGPLELKTPRFYAPQAGQLSFAGISGQKLASAILDLGDEEWGDLTAAMGPDYGPEAHLLKTRLIEQREIMGDAGDEAETLRHIVEEARFIRQDIARLGKKSRGALLQRRLGKMIIVFNRIARSNGSKAEISKFDQFAAQAQQAIESTQEPAFEETDFLLSEMRDLFFSIAWRDSNYVRSWFQRLASEPFLFPEAAEFQRMVSEGEKVLASDNISALRTIVGQMLAARVSLNANESVSELATIIGA